MNLLRHLSAVLLAAASALPAVADDDAVMRLTLPSKIFFSSDGPVDPGVPGGGTNNGPLDIIWPSTEARSVAQLSIPVTITGGAPPYTVTVNGLPPGLAYDHESRAIVGQTTFVGSSPLTFSITDGNSGQDTLAGVTLTTLSPLFATVSVPDVVAGEAFTINPSPLGLYGAGTWDVTGLSDLNLSFNPANGQISGTIANPGTVNGVVLGVTDAYDNLRAQTDPFSITVQPPAPPSASLPAVMTAYTGRVFSVVPTTQNVRTPAVWSVIAGELPGWAAFDSATGRIHGTPAGTAVSQAGIKLRVVDASHREAETDAFTLGTSQAYNVSLNVTGTFRQNATRTLQATATAASPTWTVSGPTWITVNSSGLVTISPTTNGGPFSFSTRATQDGWGETTNAINVLAPLSFSAHPGNFSAQAGAGVAQSATPILDGGPQSPVYSLDTANTPGGSIPLWLSVSSNGRVNATPSSDVTPGSYGPYVVTVTDSTGGSASTSAFTVTVSASNPWSVLNRGGTGATSYTSMIPCILTDCTSMGGVPFSRNSSGTQSSTVQAVFVNNVDRYVTSMTIKYTSNTAITFRVGDGVTETNTVLTAAPSGRTTTITVNRNMEMAYFYCHQSGVACNATLYQLKPNF